jgi:hypothetical protein
VSSRESLWLIHKHLHVKRLTTIEDMRSNEC